MLNGFHALGIVTDKLHLKYLLMPSNEQFRIFKYIQLLRNQHFHLTLYIGLNYDISSQQRPLSFSSALKVVGLILKPWNSVGKPKGASVGSTQVVRVLCRSVRS